MKGHPFLLLACAGAILAGAAAYPQAGKTVSYKKEVAPLMTRACISCHRQGDADGRLMLDTPAGMLRGGKAGKLFVAGKSKTSQLLIRVRGEGGKDRMPKKAPPLKASEIDMLARWVDQGAKFD